LLVDAMCSAANVIIEKRRSLRRRVLKRAKALLNDNKTVLDCVIRDLSDEGARLQIEHASTLPRLFRLANISDGEVRDVRVVWRKDAMAGVAFMTAEDTGSE
jgi:ribosomal protein S1